MKFLFAIAIILGLQCLTSADKVDVDGYLKNLTEGFKRDDHSAVPSIETRVQILADIFNAFDLKHKNLTNQEFNIRDAAREFKKRTRQFDQYKTLSLAYLEREFQKHVENYTKVHEDVQSTDNTSALNIANKILPFTTKISNYGEKLNQLYQDEKITIYIDKYRNESYSMIGDQKEKYKEIEARMFTYLMKVAKLAGHSRFDNLRNPKLTRKLEEETKKLETIDPKDLDVMLEQYEIGRALYATRKLLTIILECEAILEGIPNPFMRQHNTIDDQQSKEYFGVRP